MDSIFAYRKEYELIDGYSVEFTMDRTKEYSLQAAWSPDVPSNEAKTAEFMKSYCNARDDFIGSLGLNTMIVEI
jgi:hypothetical protein